MNYDRDSLILNHLELAKTVALSEWRTATHALHKDDMISLANLGLVDAANRWEDYCRRNNYDPAAIQYFQVFARLRIRGTIRDQIRKDDWATRTLRSKAKKLKDAGQDEGLSESELAERTGMTQSEVRKTLAKLATKPVSLDSMTYVDQSDTGSHTTLDLANAEDTESLAFSRAMLSGFIESINKLEPEIRLVLVLHYYKKLDLRKIAEELNLPETKVSQLHSSGILEIKDNLTKIAEDK